MKYSDGQEVMVGDKVQVGRTGHGVVVCSFDTGDYAPDFPRRDWEYLVAGILIKTEASGLFHYVEPDEDLQLIARNTP